METEAGPTDPRRRRLFGAGVASAISLTALAEFAMVGDASADAITTGDANVRDFGAVGDGHTDDTKPFADAIASLPAGGTVIVPPGLYSVSQIRLRRRINLIGRGWNSTLLQRSNVSGSMVVLDDHNVEFTRVSSLMLNGNRDQQTTGNSAIDYNNSGGTFSFYDPNHIIDNVLIFRPKGYGIRLSLDCRESKVSTVYVIGAGQSSFSISCTDSTFADCTAAGSDLSGWDLTGPNNKFSNCKAFGNGMAADPTNDSGFFVRQNRQLLSNCEAQDNGGHGFFVVSDENVLAGCLADANGTKGVNRSGFRLQGADRTMLTGYEAMNRTGTSSQQYGVDIDDLSTSATMIGSSNGNTTSDLNGSVRLRYVVINGKRVEFSGVAPPTTGVSLYGEVIKNSQPAPGAPTGWVCVLAGSPGTWVALPPIEGSANMVLPAASGGDDTSLLNAALARGAGRVITAPPGAAYQISAPLIVRSNTTLQATGASFTLRPGANCNMLQNAATQSVVRTLSNVTITPGSAGLTGPAGTFTVDDVGRSVVVLGAGGSGGSLCARIVDVNPDGHATLDAVATAASTGATVMYDRDNGITVIGGIWDRQANVGTGRNAHSLVLRRCDRARISGLTFRSTAGRYAVDIGDVADAVVTGISLAVSSDGVHVQGPAIRTRISDIFGTTGGDTVSLNARDVAPFDDIQGDITDITVTRVNCCASSGSLVRLHGGVGVRFRDVILSEVTGFARRGIWAVEDTPGTTLVKGLRIDQLDVTLAGVIGATAVDLTITSGADAALSNVTVRAIRQYYGVIFGGWERASVAGLVTAAADGQVCVPIRVTGVMNTLDISQLSVTFAETAGSNGVDINSTASVGTLTVCRSRQVSGRCLISLTGTAPTIMVSDSSVAGAARLMNIGTSSDVTLSNVIVNDLLAAAVFVSGSAAVTLRGSVYRTNSTNASALQRQATQVVHCTNPDLPIDVSVLARAPGDAALNVNSKLSCGPGPVISNGSLWKNLFTGLTY